MALNFKGNVLDVVIDQAQVYDDDGKAIPGKTAPRIRARVIPLKPESVMVNITNCSEVTQAAFKALVGKTVVFPCRVGQTDSGMSFLSVQSDLSPDDIDLIAQKPIPPAAQQQNK